jgi:hypothetical protein
LAHHFRLESQRLIELLVELLPFLPQFFELHR